MLLTASQSMSRCLPTPSSCPASSSLLELGLCWSLLSCCEVLVAASSCPLRLWLNGFGSLSQQKGPPPACWVDEVEPFWVLGISLLQTELHSGSPQKGAVVEEVRGKKEQELLKPCCPFITSLPLYTGTLFLLSPPCNWISFQTGRRKYCDCERTGTGEGGNV